ncbi:MAG: hypoxanthine phosphoribosyltransferase [Phycisphaerae bacterium]
MGKQGVTSASGLYRDIARVAVPRRRIAAGVRRLASRIADAYPDGEVTILAVLTGSLIFLADLMRRLPLRMRVEVVSVVSYPGTAVRSRGAKVLGPVPASLRGRNVLIVDDILDSGRTLAKLLSAVAAQRPAAVRTCVLLRKRRPDLPRRPTADFVGFDVPDEFVVGYGLDFDNLYRNLPDICVLKRHARRGVPWLRRLQPRTGGNEGGPRGCKRRSYDTLHRGRE